MMIFLLILKIIGIVLCVILGILAVILFVPICYEVDAGIDAMDYKGRVRWLGRLIRFEFRWKEKTHAVLKILWFVIDFTDPEAVAARKAKKEAKARKKQQKLQKKEARKNEKQARQNQKEAQQQASDREAWAQRRAEFRKQQEAESLSDESNELEKMQVKEKTVTENVVSESVTEAERIDIDEPVEHKMTGVEASVGKHASETDQQSVSEEASDVLEKEPAQENGTEEKISVREKLKSAREKAGSVKEKVKNGIAVIRFLKEQELIPAVWVKLKTFLLHIRPRILRGHLQFGLTDPANTGQVLGGIAMIPFLYQTELQIEPDFETDENYIKGQVYTRGHMCCIHLVILIVRLLLDKKIRGVIHMIRENE